MVPLKYATSFIVVMAASLVLLIPLIAFSPPRDGEVWLHQVVTEMQASHRLVPVLNNEPLTGHNPLSLAALAVLPAGDIATPRLVSLILGGVFVGFVFFYSLALFDLASAFIASVVAMTSLGFFAVFATMNLSALPVTLAATAFGLFSLVYLKRLHSLWYVLSYVLAAVAAVTGGYFMLVFFLLGALLLILLDLEPSRLFSIHLAAGLSIIGCIVIAYFVPYRIALGPLFTETALSPGYHIGLMKGVGALVMYASPWIFLVVPAWIFSGGPSDQEAWRTMLPLRIALVLGLLLLWFGSSGLPQYATVMVAFTSPAIGCWMAHHQGTGTGRDLVGFIMMALTGIAVFIWALVLLFPISAGFSFAWRQLIAAAALLAATGLFTYCAFRRRVVAQFALIVAAVVFIVGYTAFPGPQGQWGNKISYMESISKSTPLIVYEDDLVMRGYLSAVHASPMVVDRNAVPLREAAFLAVSTPDLEEFIDGLSGHTHPVVLNSFRAETTYSLVMITPGKRSD